MAKFISNHFAVISGSVNGTTYSRNRVAAYTRNRSKPVNRQSVVQQLARFLLGSISSLWRALTDAQRNAWNSAAAGYSFSNGVDGTYVPSGSQLHTTVNINRYIDEDAYLEEPLPPGTAGAIVSAVAAINVTAGTFTALNEITGGSNATKIYATPPVSEGLSSGSIKNKFRGVLNNTTGKLYSLGQTNVATSIVAFYDAQFGTDIAGNTAPTGAIWFKFVPIKTDFTDAPPIIVKVVVTP